MRLDSDDTTLFEQFLETHTPENKEKLDHILSWIKAIGNRFGAKEFYFRNESLTADTRALPPKGIQKEPHYLEDDALTDEAKPAANNLRLYCFRASESVVVLFSGNLKTAQKAQDCPSVKPYFLQANKLSAALERAFREGVIRWNDDYSDIICDEPIDYEG
ncbi:MAG: hypothetical protein JJU35_15225 [Balneolales bacterium]|nr:hypothetical protein [Balneolales bacterium]